MTFLFNTLSTRQFLRDYWQKKPLLIRQAFPDFTGLLNKKELITLATREEVQSRLVQFSREKWSVSHGPFRKKELLALKKNGTLLVQNVNHFLPQADALLNQFNFIPYARLDDLMVSVAPDGGGVGPHFDSYDVFLLQGAGKRLWQISNQSDRQLVSDAPLRILQHFQPEQEWVLEPGDMLYLPPQYAHNGIAVGECMTYSIGFRAPSYQELIQAFLMYLEDHIEIDGMYTDPGLKMSMHPARIPEEMIKQVGSILKHIRFGRKEVGDFLGKYLTEPKAHVFFTAPHEIISKPRFKQRLRQQGIRLDLKSQMLFTKNGFYMNGDVYFIQSQWTLDFMRLADHREVIFSKELDTETIDLLYEWYLNGYLRI